MLPGLVIFALGIAGFVLVNRKDRATVAAEDEGLSDEALELRRIRRLIQNVIGVGLAVGVVVLVWHQVDAANKSAEEKADRTVACILADLPADC